MEQGRYFCPVKKLHHQVVLSVGCNMGDCSLTFLKASETLEKERINITKKSSLYQTGAWGNTDQNDFLNQIWVATTTLEPVELLVRLKMAEMQFGRMNREKWQPRPLDLDILFYDDLIFKEHELKIPHPQLAMRKFVLIPLAEILPEMIHPETKKTVLQMLDECNDNSTVKCLTNHAESN